MLERFKAKGYLEARGKQRTDSTHVLSAVRQLNRLESVGETLRAALNSLAMAAPEWLREQVTTEWFERYGRRVEEYRLPIGNKRSVTWVGYKAHLTETCDEDTVHVITDVKTTNACLVWRDCCANVTRKCNKCNKTILLCLTGRTALGILSLHYDRRPNH